MSETERFSLKDHLFNEGKVRGVAKQIKAVCPAFKDKEFVRVVVRKFPELELMERIGFIAESLRASLPGDYEEALAILLTSLPPPCDPTLSDNDFGDFIYAPFGHFVSVYGCEKRYLKVSLAALREITQRFSAEWAIRRFLNEYPKETLSELRTWTKDSHYHVRRLVSEGTRPNLPWAKKVNLIPEDTLPLLELLYTDKTRFVTRSVANHLNDLAKTNPSLVIDTLKRWQKGGLQSESELTFISKHALRTLVKRGDKEALALLGYQSNKVVVESIEIQTPTVRVGESLVFIVRLRSTDKTTQSFVIDYVIDFMKANGSTTPKVHKLATRTLKPGEHVSLCKKHPLRVMSTRKLYSGTHTITIQVNGIMFPSQSFLLY